MRQKKEYVVMHGEKEAARIGTDGNCEIFRKDFMPFSLWLEDTSGKTPLPDDEKTDILVNNVTNFYFWCASRVLTLDRAYAKEILNSIGAVQAQTDRERAKIALSYHCLTLTDLFWVKERGEAVTFREINLFENHLDNALVDIALRGRQITVTNRHLIADDLSTNGVFPKAWVRKGDMFLLWKDGSQDSVERELLASRICQCFRCRQVVYREQFFEGQKVSESAIVTSLDYGMVSREEFEIYAQNREIDVMDYILRLDGYSYYMMNILDYLVGNTDRHWGNWGFLVDNRTNLPVRLSEYMDLNQSFQAYDTTEGANALTVERNAPRSQLAAAVEAVKKVGLNQEREVRKEWFAGREAEYEMFRKRMEILQGLF